MEESTILIYFDKSLLSDDELFVVSNFGYLLDRKWLSEEFATFCIENIDGNKHNGGADIVSPYLGSISPTELSGGAQTLLVAYNNKDKIYPLDNLGDNCAEALYRSGIGEPTKWLYDGYCPELLPNQKVIFVETGEEILGKDMSDWELYSAPDEFFDMGDDSYMDEPLPTFPD